MFLFNRELSVLSRYIGISGVSLILFFVEFVFFLLIFGECNYIVFFLKLYLCLVFLIFIKLFKLLCFYFWNECVYFDLCLKI